MRSHPPAARFAIAVILFTLLPYQPLTEDLAREVGERLARMIAVLQPLLDEASAQVRLSRGTGEGNRRQRRYRRGR